jgi:hypothetical protein
METRFQTSSFVPKASLDNIVDDQGHIQRSSGSASGTSSIFILLSFFLFICSVVSAGIIFSLNQLALSQQKVLSTSLSSSEKDISTDTIDNIKALNNRLSVIQALLDRHVAVSLVFNELAQNTIKQVSFSSFDLKRNNDNTFALILKAQGIGYESIVAQDTQFSTGPAQKFFKNTSITDFIKSKGQDLTTFGVETTVSDSGINFSQVVNSTIK